MNVLVLNGSPKGPDSVTLQFAEYLAKRYPEHRFNSVPVARDIRRFERDDSIFDDLMSQTAAADLIVWAFPLYYLLVHSGYKRFVELVFERGRGDAFAGRYAVSLSTSIHFYDHTAHNYVHGVCDDLKMRYLDGYPAGMHDLFDERERERLVGWFADVVRRIDHGEVPPRVYAPVTWEPWKYRSDGAATDRDPVPSLVDSSPAATIVTDSGTGNTAAMVRRLRQTLPNATVLDLGSIRMGHCLGCLKCGFDNVCVYEGTKDQFLELFRQHVLPARVVIFAGLRFVFQADHKYYRRHGLYDFPWKRRRFRLKATMMTLLTAIPFMRREVRDQLKPQMVAPYRRIVAAAGSHGAARAR